MASQLIIARRKIGNSIFVAFCWLGAAVALTFLALILLSLITKGLGGIDIKIFTMDTPAPGSPGGLRNAILGSIMMCALAMVMALTIGVLAGTWLAEYAGQSLYGKVVRFVNDVLLSAPSILIGLFVYTILVAPFHGFSGIAGAVALALLAVPVVTRTTEDVMNLQPSALREAGVALGSPLASTIRRILWRASSTGILTGGLNNQFFSWNLTKPTANLPTVIFNYALSAYDDWQRLAWVGAALIAFAVLFVNIIARTLARESRRS